MKPNTEYLQHLIEETHNTVKEWDCTDVADTDLKISYVPTKKDTDIGLQEGIYYREMYKGNRIVYKSRIRSHCNSYNKFYYREKTLVKVEIYLGGHDRLDVRYLAKYCENKRYLYPAGIGNAGLSTIVTEYENGLVRQEYRVWKNQIVFTRYDYAEDGTVDCYYVNYVPKGTYPILEETERCYNAKTLEYTELSHYNWHEDFKMPKGSTLI